MQVGCRIVCRLSIRRVSGMCIGVGQGFEATDIEVLFSRLVDGLGNWLIEKWIANGCLCQTELLEWRQLLFFSDFGESFCELAILANEAAV